MSERTAETDPSSERAPEPELVSCEASMRTGALLDRDVPEALREQLEAFASTLPELFGTIDVECLARIAVRAGADAGDGLTEMLLLSEDRLHLVQPLQRRPGVALLAIGAATGSIGLALSEFRARVARAEAG